MDEFDTGNLIYLIVLLLMVGGWFFMQSREGLNKTLQYAAVWMMIFIGGAAAVGLWQDISRDARTPQFSVAGSDQIIVPRARDGHYYLTAEVNGTALRFVVDTGATDMVLTQTDAKRAGIDPASLAYMGRANTANGEVRTAFVRLDQVQLGGVVDTDVAAVVNEGQMEQSLLGMGYLQRWGRIEITGGELILTR
ncbi:TIGR02281 family clan AA aspartic protease [Sulfitobacter sp. M57]|uniref:retropepsin-like aspartic protease family protein n=1 Tax=unclassified Sulfitobacter TaxID=196795 RepID=UPI0023E29D1D|nr:MULTISPECIES: TIGR02281 family clan AA aspartic protease [unclassified Sulfitobacter]MDF3413881.1 TIGR02281 family clan AA aspartic protease [Sulfitobacter sp. KE5]MDF3420838.1 TIGR02281 family clan AA aspartic protease [Sulfitobacter sp. KE43]MDF3432427.1 TIGR02281 family clan AA aspartic protease [Sulfitobacter sp. KE42]MDF3458066.1 TIGR02281 family clan AA aspartic protease [Sulfitobacter sp. S74]MDF3461967.1 TIGR02281 family clan AA aspartic protease [Sulfitobacter sp. Ks18]